MNDVLNFLWEYRYILLWVLFFGVFALSQWNGFKAKVTALMLDAKKLAKDGVLKNGQQQVEWIVLKAYQKLPKRYQLLKEDTMKKVIKWLYDKAMDYIDDGQFNNSITQ
jgi:hypothetical protein